MVKFTEEDRKWLVEHKAQKTSFDSQKMEKYEIVIVDNGLQNRVILMIENSPYNNNFEVNICSNFMTNIRAYGTDMFKTSQLCFDYWRMAKTIINQNEVTLMDYQI